MFEVFQKDTVTVIKKDGSRFDDVAADVQEDRIFIEGREPLIEIGDHIERRMSNGGTEMFEVLDPGFHEELEGIPAGYQIKVHKVGTPSGDAQASGDTYNVSGPNARINVESIDNSVNVVQLPDGVVQKLDELRAEIEAHVSDETEREEALEVAQGIEDELHSEAPRRGIVKRLVEALPQAGNIASIGSFILTWLGP